MEMTTTVSAGTISVHYKLDESEIQVLKILNKEQFLELRGRRDEKEEELINFTLTALEQHIPFFEHVFEAWHTTFKVTDKEGLRNFIDQLEK